MSPAVRVALVVFGLVAGSLAGRSFAGEGDNGRSPVVRFRGRAVLESAKPAGPGEFIATAADGQATASDGIRVPVDADGRFDVSIDAGPVGLLRISPLRVGEASTLAVARNRLVAVGPESIELTFFECEPRRIRVIDGATGAAISRPRFAVDVSPSGDRPTLARFGHGTGRGAGLRSSDDPEGTITLEPGCDDAQFLSVVADGYAFAEVALVPESKADVVRLTRLVDVPVLVGADFESGLPWLAAIRETDGAFEGLDVLTHYDERVVTRRADGHFVRIPAGRYRVFPTSTAPYAARAGGGVPVTAAPDASVPIDLRAWNAGGTEGSVALTVATPSTWKLDRIEVGLYDWDHDAVIRHTAIDASERGAPVQFDSVPAGALVEVVVLPLGWSSFVRVGEGRPTERTEVRVPPPGRIRVHPVDAGTGNSRSATSIDWRISTRERSAKLGYRHRTSVASANVVEVLAPAGELLLTATDDGAWAGDPVRVRVDAEAVADVRSTLGAPGSLRVVASFEGRAFPLDGVAIRVLDHEANTTSAMWAARADSMFVERLAPGETTIECDAPIGFEAAATTVRVRSGEIARAEIVLKRAR